MGLRISTNVQALAAQRQLGINSGLQKTSLEHLSSGSRINKAADDAAGLAISEKMRGQIRSIRQDIRNANDGISMIQTAEGGMNEVSNLLIRMRELSIQGASDTVGDTERGFIDKEVQQLRAEVDRIAEATEFNGTKLLNGTGHDIEVQVGQFNRPGIDRFTFSPQKLEITTGKMGLGDVSVATRESSQGNLEKIDAAINELNSNRSEVGALQNRFNSAIASLQIYDENLSAARSRIADVDMATETGELTKQNILTQAGISVLSQANQNNMAALKLLG